MSDLRTKTLREFLQQVAEYSYDHGDYNVIKDTIKEKEVEKFVESYIAGAEILKDGKDGKPVTIRGKAGDDKGSTGDEVLFCHDYLLYDLTGQSGEWVVVTFTSLEDVEKHIISEGGYLNVYCTEMIVMKDGVIQPFEILFTGDNDITVVLDKDIIDEETDLKGMQSRLSVRWLPLEEEEKEQ
ncbi:MAG: hypothetical protein GX299_00520 [Epulopiscium sp.]|jgi:hypothetical protein|nr:hypothetical protein [Candidatus Epulonipiscium sp.]